MSHGSSRCRFWLCSPTAGYHGRCCCSICDAVDPEIGSFQAHFVAGKSFKRHVEWDCWSGFTLGVHRPIGVCDIFVLHFFCVPRMLLLHVSQPGGKKRKGGAEGGPPSCLLFCHVLVFLTLCPFSRLLERRFVLQKYIVKKVYNM